MAREYKLYIDGKLVEGKGKAIEVTNPATNEVLGYVKAATKEQADEALLSSQKAFETWQYLSLNERIGYMFALRDKCAEHREELIDLLREECGKSVDSATAEYNWFMSMFDYFAEEAKQVTDTGLQDFDDRRELFFRVTMRPLGVVVQHLPWNGSLLFVSTKLCPGMAAGCTTVIKPSTSTPFCTLRVAELAIEAGIPAGVFNVVVGPSAEIGNHLTASTIPSMVGLVGSTETGKEILNTIGTSIKRVSLELGGNSPTIICADADLEAAADYIIGNKTYNCGQNCGCVNRIFCHESVHDKFIEILKGKLENLKCGWGKDNPHALGTLINRKERDRLLGLVDEALKDGATLVHGGKIPDYLPDNLKDGAFIEPTLITNVRDDMHLAYGEIFGPIYSVLTPFKDVDEVLARANDTIYGLTSYIFSHDSRIIAKVAEHLEFGKVIINGSPVRSPNMPHIGNKQSGVGCIFSTWSMEEFYKRKLIALNP